MSFEDLMQGRSAGMAGFTRDLTQAAREGDLDPVRCRSAEIDRVIDILLRHGKNNPVLVGAAGVGKTAIVEGLAQRLASGDVPLALRTIRILSLDHVGLLAGTTYRGQYEERIRSMVEEVTKSPDVILFIDEMHNLIGQGTAMGVAMDAANMLKPALVRGDFRVIGATTDAEYERWIRGDPALERRFQKVAVRELGVDETLEIMRARKMNLERHHNVVIAEDALLASVALTDKYVTDRMRPDRALDALDEACAHLQARAVYSPAAEALIRERRGVSTAGGAAEASSGSDRASPDAQDDPLELFARDGMRALERIGAELEAMLGGPESAAEWRTRSKPSPAQGSAPRADAPAASSTTRRSTAQVDADLERRLIEEGVVVRGHDVARVVGVASGYTVSWPS